MMLVGEQIQVSQQLKLSEIGIGKRIVLGLSIMIQGTKKTGRLNTAFINNL
jgi:hypothetical protein